MLDLAELAFLTKAFFPKPLQQLPVFLSRPAGLDALQRFIFLLIQGNHLVLLSVVQAIANGELESCVGHVIPSSILRCSLTFIIFTSLFFNKITIIRVLRFVNSF